MVLATKTAMLSNTLWTQHSLSVGEVYPNSNLRIEQLHFVCSRKGVGGDIGVQSLWVALFLLTVHLLMGR